MTRCEVSQPLSADARRLFELLWPKGGGVSYYWHAKRSAWFEAGAPPDLPADDDVYFGVNLVGEARAPNQRSTKATITHLAALIAEFDAKDFDGSLQQTRRHVETLPIPPSAAVMSGGGIHAYWPLIWPVPVNDETRDGLVRTQRCWVKYVGGDGGAKDIARVLRVPGTLNAKYSPPRLVELLWLDRDYFLLDCLVQRLDTFAPSETAGTSPTVPAPMPERGRTQISDRGRAYGLAALENELRRLAVISRGGRNDALNKAALKLGALVAGGLLDQVEVARGLYTTALAMGTDHSFTDSSIRATIRSGLAAGLQNPRGIPDDN